MKEGWEMKRLGEVCTLQRGFDLPAHLRISGTYPLVSSNGITDRINEFKIKAPGVVTGRSGSIGNIHFIEEDFWPLNTALYIKDFHGNYPRYIFYLLTQFNLSRFTSGTGVPTLNRNHVHGEKVFITTSLPEQHRIVAILDQAFAAIDKAKANAEKNLQNAKELFEGYLQGVFEGKGEGWEDKPLGEIVVEMMTGPFGSMLHKSDYVEKGIPVVNPQNIINGELVSLQKTMISETTFARLDKYALKENDIIMARRGEMGRCAIVKKENVGWLCGTGSLVIRPNKNKVDESFLNLFLGSSRVKSHLEKASIGATMNNLNQNILSETQIILPPINQQKEIMGKLDALSTETQKLQAIYQQKINDLEELKQSILEKAFKGELDTSKLTAV